MLRSAAILALVCLIALPSRADPQAAMAIVSSIPGVLRAEEDTAGNLWVAVTDNPKTPWNTVANNICKIVIPQQARIFLVKIVDAASIAPKSKPSQWKMIGGANCGMVQ